MLSPSATSASGVASSVTVTRCNGRPWVVSPACSKLIRSEPSATSSKNAISPSCDVHCSPSLSSNSVVGQSGSSTGPTATSAVPSTSSNVAVTVVAPSPTPVNSPSSSTVATSESSTAQAASPVTSSVESSSNTAVAVNCSVPSSSTSTGFG